MVEEKENSSDLETEGKLYLLNSPVLTNYGIFEYWDISLLKAKEIIASRTFISAIGHEPTANFLSKLAGINILANRISITMKPGDVAIVFRVLQRLPEGRVLTEDELAKIPYEFGILQKRILTRCNKEET